jgi:predicted metal-dependent TIM-barrel fold hydrolase
MANSAGDWGPSKPTAIPDLIMELKKRGHPRELIRRVVYENPLEFFSQSPQFQPPNLA